MGWNTAAAVSGMTIWMDALAARLTLTADDTSVYVLGHRIPWECAMRRAGLPCPTCGITRSLVMTLHGEIGKAWHMAPIGPVLMAGVLVAALLLLASCVRTAPLPRWVRAGGIAYAAAALLIWIGGWAVRFGEAWQSR